MIATLTALLLTAPPTTPRVISAPTEDACHLQIDPAAGEASWEVVRRNGRQIRRYNIAKNRAISPPKFGTPIRGISWTRSPRTPMVNVLTDSGRWAIQIGGKEPAAPSAASDIHGAISPDRKTVAFVSGRSGQGDIYLTPANKSNQSPRRLSSGALPDVRPTWSPAGKHLAFLRLSERGRQLIVLSGVSGGAVQERVAADERDAALFLSWRPDSKQIAFYGRDWSVGTALYTVDPSMGGASKVIGDVTVQWGGPAWIPESDGSYSLLVVRNGTLVVIDKLGEQKVLDTGAFGIDEVAAAPVGRQKRTVVFTALGLEDDENADPRYRKVYKWVFP